MKKIHSFHSLISKQFKGEPLHMFQLAKKINIYLQCCLQNCKMLQSSKHCLPLKVKMLRVNTFFFASSTVCRCFPFNTLLINATNMNFPESLNSFPLKKASVALNTPLSYMSASCLHDLSVMRRRSGGGVCYFSDNTCLPWSDIRLTRELQVGKI